jgi:hypothetical protein
MALKKFPRRQDFVNAIQYLENFEEVLNSVKQLDSFPNKDIVWFDRNIDRLLFL